MVYQSCGTIQGVLASNSRRCHQVGPEIAECANGKNYVLNMLSWIRHLNYKAFLHFYRYEIDLVSNTVCSDILYL